MICYLAFVFIIGVPVLCAEFCMGRQTRSNITGAYNKLASGSKWHLAGYIGILASVLILSFYSVVAGWTIEYCVSSMFGSLDFSDRETGHEQFMQLTTGWRPVVWTVVFLLCNFYILMRGSDERDRAGILYSYAIAFYLVGGILHQFLYFTGVHRGDNVSFQSGFQQNRCIRAFGRARPGIFLP